MRVDFSALALRLGLAWFLFSCIVLLVYLFGAAQSFLETTLRDLFVTVHWLSWGGLLTSWLLLLPLARFRVKRVVLAFFLGVGFLCLFLFIVLWGSWIYPGIGSRPW